MRIVSLSPRRGSLYAATFDFPIDFHELKLRNFKDDCLLLDRDFCDETGIIAGLSLSLDELLDMVTKSERRRAKRKAFWFLSAADCSAKGLRTKLMRTFSADAADFAVERMVHFGYINDENYAHRLADSINAKGIGGARAVGAMISKGIDRSLAVTALEESNADPIEQLCILIEKRYRLKLSTPDDLRRTTAALARRGFSFGDIRTAIKKYTGQSLECEE